MDQTPTSETNPFDPANLSPLRQTPRACALPYNLTWEDLEPILSGYNEHRDGEVQAFESHQKQGLNGGSNSCIITLRYPLGKDQLASKTVFIKRIRDPKKSEAHKYQFLSEQGIPTPHLLKVIWKDSSEIILLEFLPTIGIDFRNLSEVKELLYLVARVNSVRNPPVIFERAPRDPRSELNMTYDTNVQAVLTEMSLDRTLPFRIDPSRWFTAYQIAQDVSGTMPLAVNHDEFYFQQVGWAERGMDRQLVIFDLETMSLRPRFVDIANILYPLMIYTGRDQIELFRIYLDQLCELNQIKIGLHKAFRELRLLRISELCQSLPWLVAATKDPDAIDIREVLPMATNCLFDDLLALKLM